jgi:UDP-glucose 4-epimerase
MRILVTGGAGFIASHVTEAMLAAGHEVMILDNLSTGRRDQVPEGATFVEADVTGPDFAAVVKDYRPELIDHHAAHADVVESVLDPASDARTNVVGTVRMIKAAVDAGVGKMIFISSGGAIYGEPDYLPVDEAHPTRPLSPYAAAKAAGEIYMETLSRIHGIDYTILRYANVYGPRQHPYTEEGQVVALFARFMLEGRRPKIFGDGEQARDFVYVSDVVDANMRAIDRGSRETLNIGTGNLVTVNQLYAQLQALTGYSEPAEYAPARPGEVYLQSLDASRAREKLGWTPRMPMDEGLRATVDWIRSTMTPAGAR